MLFITIYLAIGFVICLSLLVIDTEIADLWFGAMWHSQLIVFVTGMVFLPIFMLYSVLEFISARLLGVKR